MWYVAKRKVGIALGYEMKSFYSKLILYFTSLASFFKHNILIKIKKFWAKIVVCSTIELIGFQLISSCLTSANRKDKLAAALENEGYLKKLLNVFHMCEDLENTQGLQLLYEIFKNIFMLNKNALFEVMFAGKLVPI